MQMHLSISQHSTANNKSKKDTPMSNLIKLSALKSIPLYVADNTKCHNIYEIIFEPTGVLSGFVICRDGIISQKKYVHSKALNKISEQGIWVKSAERLNPKKSAHMQYSSSILIGMAVKSSNGELMGTLSDIYMNTEKLQTMAVEISRSFFEDLFGGRLIIPGKIISMDSYGIIISQNQMENSLHNTKGIINAIDEGLSRE